MNETDIVKWAAGAPIELGESAIDDDLLLQLIRRHRLEMRFWDRARNTKPPWALRRVFLKILPRCQMVRKNVAERIALTQEIASLTRSTDDPVVVIKGIATYALLGREEYQKYSNDVDVLFSDLPFLVEQLESREFVYGRGQWASHEYGSLKRERDKTTIEPHRFFPVYSYPNSLPADLVPENNSGRWLQNTCNRVRRDISYADLLENSQPGVAPGTQDLRVPNPTMAALLLCAHEFRDYLQRPCRESFVHLATLADINDLARHPQFDRERFLGIVETYRGHDSVRLVRYLSVRLLETDPFPFFADEPTDSEVCQFPQLLNYKGGWVLLEEKPDDILARLSTVRVVERLGANVVAVSRLPRDPGETERGRTPPDVENAPINRVVVQVMGGADSQDTNIRFDVAAWIDRHLLIEITLFDPLEVGFNYQIKLYSDEGINDFHDVHLPASASTTSDGLPQLDQRHRENVYAYWRNGQCCVRFSLTETFPAGAEAPLEPLAITLLLTKWRWEREEIFEAASPVVIVPLWLSPSAPVT